MSELPLKNQIIEWLKTQQYWYQYAGNQILEGAQISEALIKETFNFFKQDASLIELGKEREPINFNEIPQVIDGEELNLKLKAIHSIENVNALASGQRIDVDKNLTVIYGNNGSGKSGYIRLINNTFQSRGDKTLLGNVFTDSANGIPTCKFEFQNAIDTYEREYPKDKGCIEFSQYSAFDTESIKVHLDNDNQLNFTPTGFEFFEKVIELFEKLKAKLNEEIKRNRPQNSFEIHFQNENVFKTQIRDLGSKTKVDEIKKLADFTESDAKELEEIKSKIGKLKALNVQVQISGLEKLLRELAHFKQKQELSLNFLSKEKVDYCFELIDSYNKLYELSKSEGLKSLEEYNIGLVSSPEWREFIIAAKNYTNTIEKHRQVDLEYPTNEDHCIFCLQPLNDKENKLINTYWQFLKSEAERELNRTREKIKGLEKELKGLNPVKFDETLALYEYLNSIDPILVSKWKSIVTKTENTKANLIQNLANLTKEFPASSFTDSTTDFDIISVQIKKEIDVLFAKKPDQEIASLTFKLLLLTDKSLFKKLLPEVIKFISTHKWADSAVRSLSLFRTNALTTFQGSLFTQHILKLLMRSAKD